MLLLGPLVAGALAAPLAACKPSTQEVEAERGPIREALESYNRKLSQAYAYADAAPLEGIASPKEIANVRNNIARLSSQGRRIASELGQLTIEDLNLYQASNAYVQTFEVWDIRVYAVGSDQEISRDPEQRSRVRYQVKRGDDGGWKVLWRQRIDTEGENGEAPVSGAGGPGGT